MKNTYQLNQKNPQLDNLRFELEQLRNQNRFLEQEVTKYKEIIAKTKNQTEKKVEIVREIHTNDAPYGLNNKEVEDLATRNVLLELEVKRLHDENVNKVPRE